MIGKNLNILFTYAHAYSQCLLDSRLSRWHCYSTQYSQSEKQVFTEIFAMLY